MFTESHRANNKDVKGLDSKERTFIAEAKHREILSKLANSELKKDDVTKAINSLNQTNLNENVKLVRKLLEQLLNRQNIEVYRRLLSELSK